MRHSSITNNCWNFWPLTQCPVSWGAPSWRCGRRGSRWRSWPRSWASWACARRRASPGPSTPAGTASKAVFWGTWKRGRGRDAIYMIRMGQIIRFVRVIPYALACLSLCIKDIHRQNITYPHVDHVACTRSIFIISAWVHLPQARPWAMIWVHTRAPPKRSKTVVLAKMQKLHHLKQISELNIPVGVIFNGNA